MNTQKGFTLIELLVVIAIIGLLSSVILASLNTARAKSRDARRQSDLKSIQVALELYYSNFGAYPITTTGGVYWRSQCVGWGPSAGVGFAADLVIPGLVPTYISQMPADPAMVVSANQNCYLYRSDDGQDYKFLNYNVVDSANPGSSPSLVDPARNFGQSYARPPGCSNAVYTEATKSMAIYTPSYMCY